MLDHAVLTSVAQQLMGSMASGRNPHAMEHPGEVVVGGQVSQVQWTGSRRFRTVRFRMGGNEYQAIEQNPEKPSRWGKLARDGHRVVQFRDLVSGKYVAVVVDDKVMEYQGR
jgi:hypothetical protein